MKALLYCTKGKPLFLTYGDCDNGDYATYFEEYVCDNHYYDYGYDDKVIEPKDFLNGKIVGECDYEIEKIKFNHINERDDLGRLHNEWWWEYRGLNIGNYQCELAKESCLNSDAIMDYLGNKDGKAIHIKNLHIFNKPKELSDYCYATYPHTENVKYEFLKNDYSSIIYLYDCEKAPRNMARVFTWEWNEGKSDETYVLISIRPELMCKILNGECTIIVKKKVLKEMV